MNEQAETNRLTVNIGMELKVELESIPSSGSMWSWEPMVGEKGLQLLRKEIRAEGTAIGSSVIQIFTFRAATRGTYHLEFSLKRPWESAPRRTRSITVDVSPRDGDT